MKKTTLLLLSCLLGFGALNLAAGSALKDVRQDLKTTYSLRTVPVPGPVLGMAAGEFKGIAADYLLMEVGAFLGSRQEASPEDWERVSTALEQSLMLDPYFQQTYLYVQAFLTWQAKMPEKAVELLKISAQHRPWDWRPPYYIGFDYYFFLKDFDNASRYFLEAGKVEGAPVLLPLLGARFAVKSGRTEVALRLLESMLDDPTLEETERKEISQRIEAMKGVLYLKAALASYKEKEGRLPDSLEELIEKDIIKKTPSNPYASEYLYDKTTGYVYFDEVK